MAKGVKRTIGIYINGKEVESSVKGIRAAMSQLINEQNRMTVGSDEYIAHAKKIMQLRTVLDDHKKQIQSTTSSWENLQTKIARIGAGIGGFTQAVSALNGVSGNLKKIATDLAELDDTYADVMKTTNLTRDEVVELNDAFKKMDTRTSREELNQLAAVAGRLGIAKDDILGFVEAADIINVALGDVLGDNAIRDIGKMSDVFSKVQSDLQSMDLKGQMLAIGSAVNELGKTSTANEQYLVDFAGRLGGVATQAGISIQEILGFGSALDQNMQKVEMAATALQKFIMKVMGDPAKFAKMAGLEVAEFTKLLSEDANAAIKDVIRALGDKGGFQQLIPIFKDMGLDGARAVGVLSALATNIDKVDEAQRIANKAFTEGTSAIEEYDVKNNNMQANLEKARKKFQDTRLELGEKLYPVLLKLVKTSTVGTKALAALVEFMAENKGLVIAVASAWAAYTVALGKNKIAQVATTITTTASNAVLGTGKTIIYATSAAYNTLTGNTSRAAAAQQSMKLAFASTPWGAVLTALTALGVGIYKLATRTTDAEKAMKQFNEESAKAEAEARFLFSALEKTTKGSKEYKDILDKLKELYPDIINSMIDETGELKNIDEAYKLVISSIREKIALQIKEQSIQDAIAKDLKEQNEQVADIQRKIINQTGSETIAKQFTKDLKEMVAAGKNSTEIVSSLRGKYKDSGVNVFGGGLGIATIERDIWAMVDSNKELNESLSEIERTMGGVIDANKQLSEIEKLNLALARAETKEEKEAIRQQISDLEKLAAEKKKAGEIATATGGTGETELTKEEKKQLKKKQDYYKKLEEFRKKEEISRLTDFDKEKAEIISHYDEMIKEAKKFNDKKNALALEDEKQQAIYDLTLKYVEKYQKTIEKIAEKQASLTGKGETNSLIAAIAGSQKQWQDIISEIDATIRMLEYLKSTTDDVFEQTAIDASITGLKSQKGEANASMQSDTAEIIKKQMKDITAGLLSEKEKQIQAITERYDNEIKIAQAAVDELKKQDSEKYATQIAEAEAAVEKLKELRDTELEYAREEGNTWLMKLFGLTPDDLKELNKALDKLISSLSGFANQAMDIVNNFHQLKSNREQEEFNKYSQEQDARLKKLQQQYDKGLISQKKYNQEKEKIEAETEAKELEMKRAQFQREKTAATIEAVIAGALAIANIWAKHAANPILAGALTATSAAAVGMQIGVIQSQPEPYVLGGMIEKEKIIRAGEKGPEWMSPNWMVRNPETGPVIAALENYRKGKKNDFNALRFSTPSYSIANNTRLLSDVYPNNNTSSTEQQFGYFIEAVNEMKKMTEYMSDPNNRNSILQRQILTDFDEQETTLRNLSNL